MSTLQRILVGAGAVLGVLFLAWAQPVAAKQPSHETFGSYEVGAATIELSDASRPDRILFYVVFYPSLETSQDPGSVPSFPIPFFPDLTSEQWSPVLGRGFYADVPIAPGEHPVLLYSHGGGGQVAVHVLTGVIYASHGFVTAIPFHDFENNLGFRPPPVGDRMEHRVLDLRLVLDDVISRGQTPGSVLYTGIDADWVFAGGWSLGGAAALLASGLGRGAAPPDERIDAIFANDGTREELTIPEMVGNDRPKILFSQHCRATQQQLHYYTGGFQVTLEGVTPFPSGANHTLFAQICDYLTILGVPHLFPPCTLFPDYRERSRFFAETTTRYAIAFMRLEMGDRHYRRVLTPGHSKEPGVHFIPTALGQNPHKLSDNPFAPIHAFCSQPGHVEDWQELKSWYLDD